MGTQLRVLIVEDSEDDALLVVHELRCGCYDPVFERVDTAEAMSEALEKKTWDVIISDYVMPHFGGFEALRVLQRGGLDLPFIIISGKIGEDIAVDAMRAGAHDYIIKGNLTRLVPAIEREMREAEVRRERRRALEELRESEARYRNLVESARDIIFTISQEGKITSLNPAFEAITGWSRAEWIDKSFVPIVHPDDLSSVDEIYRRVMNGETPQRFELRIRTKSGSYATMEFTVTPQLYDEKAISGLGIARDITERKRMEEALRRAHDGLEMRVQERTAELARSNAELEQFAYVASHDLQEPLRMISGFTRLLARRYKGKLDKSADEYIAYIVDGAARMQRMIEDLLAYSRVGTQGKSFEPTNLEAVFDQAVTNLGVAIEHNGAAVTHDPLPTVMADDSQMVQLFQNLISNGIKFRGEEVPRVHISARIKENEWIFSVRDNGIGIAPEFFDRLFQLFQREYTRDKYPGTGIGLAICKKIVERHGGRIWAESEPGKGSIFYFTIPLRVYEITRI